MSALNLAELNLLFNGLSVEASYGIFSNEQLSENNLDLLKMHIEGFEKEPLELG